MNRFSTTRMPSSPTYLPSSPASSSSLSSSFSSSTFNRSSPLHSPFSPFSPTTNSVFSPTGFNNNSNFNSNSFSQPQSANLNNGTTSRRFYSSTYNEFSADCGPPPRSPAHPLQSSRSSLAVARSHHHNRSNSVFRQQSSEDVDAITGSDHTSFLQKSYSQQIDEVMEQLNANCELSTEESLFFGSPPKSAVSLSSSSQGSSTTTSKTERLKKNSSSAAGLTKKSNSTSQLSVSGTKKRLGFRKKQTTSFSVHRSEEVLPEDLLRQQQLSSVSSDGEGGASGGGGGSSGHSSIDWMPPLSPYGRASAGSVGGALVFDEEDDRMSTFVEGLGPGQIISRQAVASSSMGEIQLSLKSIKSAKSLEVEIVRARGLCVKSGARVLPATYVKVYLIRNRKVIAKCKTATATRRTLDPLFQQVLQFPLNYSGCSIHVIVWGDYSRMEKKVFMGVVQIVLDELNLSSTVMSWYKLFDSSSSVIGLASSSSVSGSSSTTSRSAAVLSNKHFGGSMSASMECFLGEHK